MLVDTFGLVRRRDGWLMMETENAGVKIQIGGCVEGKEGRGRREGEVNVW